jgi:hypothetical protein
MSEIYLTTKLLSPIEYDIVEYNSITYEYPQVILWTQMLKLESINIQYFIPLLRYYIVTDWVILRRSQKQKF